MNITASKVMCNLCGSKESAVLYLPEGYWRCVDVMACIMRRPVPQD